MKKVVLRCPECRGFLAEVSGYGRAVCKDCGCELTYFSREMRELTKPAPPPKVAATIA